MYETLQAYAAASTMAMVASNNTEIKLQIREKMDSKSVYNKSAVHSFHCKNISIYTSSPYLYIWFLS
jgi:hypothetical protein